MLVINANFCSFSFPRSWDWMMMTLEKCIVLRDFFSLSLSFWGRPDWVVRSLYPMPRRLRGIRSTCVCDFNVWTSKSNNYCYSTNSN